MNSCTIYNILETKHCTNKYIHNIFELSQIIYSESIKRGLTNNRLIIYLTRTYHSTPLRTNPGTIRRRLFHIEREGEIPEILHPNNDVQIDTPVTTPETNLPRHITPLVCNTSVIFMTPSLAQGLVDIRLKGLYHLVRN